MDYERAIEWLRIINEAEHNLDLDGFYAGSINKRDRGGLSAMGAIEPPCFKPDYIQLTEFGRKMLDAAESFDFYGSSDFDRAVMNSKLGWDG